MNMMSDGILDKKILRIARVNTTQAATIKLSAPGIYMKRIHPRYYREENRPSTLKGCVGTLPEGYVRNVPLPRVPVRQSEIPDYYEDQYGVPTYITPRSLVESAAYAFSPAWQAIAINT
jgi:hypothetical protein